MRRSVRILRSVTVSSPVRKAVQVARDTGLVGNDGGILGVGLAFAAVALGGPVDGPAGDVVHRLVVVVEDRDDQRGSAVGKINVPGHIVA
ncbi:hypothetical protein AQI70_34000 [Streptomyces curacoi]|uniref:Uncharacterized protein n=1 Tax=Streptomyces curacoi TaxID=146536 RepID=A0A124GUW0_9ACTN|nr:hypothetical protein AQI70_34000 [Streptomyces curacoi]